MVHWSYREGIGSPQDYFLRAGLFDLEADSAGILKRVSTPVATSFRSIAIERPAGSAAR
jgi:hypothetical protein